MKNMGRKIFVVGLGAAALAAMVPGGTAFGQSASVKARRQRGAEQESG